MAVMTVAGTVCVNHLSIFSSIGFGFYRWRHAEFPERRVVRRLTRRVRTGSWSLVARLLLRSQRRKGVQAGHAGAGQIGPHHLLHAYGKGDL